MPGHGSDAAPRLDFKFRCYIRLASSVTFFLYYDYEAETR